MILPSSSGPVRLELTGRPRLLRSDGSALFLEPYDAVLLALLALDGPLGRERACTLLWPDVPRKAAQGNLRQRLFRLRRRVGQDVVVPGPQLALASGVDHDLARPGALFEPLLADLRFDADTALDEWLEGARARRHREGSQRLAADASRLEAEGRIAEAIDVAERLVLRDPATEHAHRRVMRLHYRRGDRAAALQAYRRCRASLGESVGAEPSAETLALAATIERSGALPDASPAPPPVTLLRPPKLVGRETAWQALERGWQSAQVVLVEGEPGIGKSRLLGDFAAARQAGPVIGARPGDALMPYSAWARWLGDWRQRFGAADEARVEGELARLVPGLDVAADTPFAPLRFRQACFDALAGWFDRGLDSVVIDDLHHADAASLEALLAWCAQAPRQRIALAVRSTEAPPALVDWLAAQRGRGTVLDVTLQPLAVPDIAALLDSLDLPGAQASTWAAELARRTGGNPFFMIELLRAAAHLDGPTDLAAPERNTPHAPQRLRQLLLQRLERLPPEALQLARLAALAGTDFSVELAAAVFGIGAWALTETWAVLERSQIFRSGTFVHDLMRESAASSVPPALVKALHGTIAAALDAAHAGPARIAHHAFEAGDWAMAARNSEAAAVNAFAAVRHRETVQFCDRARECYGRIGDARAVFRLGCTAIESALHIEDDSALEARTVALLETAEGDTEVLAASIARAKYVGTTMRIAELMQAAERALTLARRLRDDKAEMTATGMLAFGHCSQGRHQQGIDLMTPPFRRFDSLPDTFERAELAVAYAGALGYSGRMGDGAHWLRRAIRDSERLGRGDDLVVAYANLALALTQVGCIDEAFEAARRSLALQRRHGADGGATSVFPAIVLGNCSKRVGRWSDAETLLKQALTTALSTAPAIVPIAENHLAALYVELGQYGRARQTLSTPPAKTATLLRRAVIEARLDVASGRGDANRLVALMTEHRDGEGGNHPDRLANRLAAALVREPAAALPIALSVRDEATALECGALAVAAAARLASASQEAGAIDQALHWARVTLAESTSIAAHDMDGSEVCWHIHQGLSARAPDEALAVVKRDLERVRASLPQVPDAYRDAYWSRSPFVPRLRSIAARGG